MRSVFGSKEDFLGSDNDLDVLLEKLKDSDGPITDLAFYCGTEDFTYEGCKSFAEKASEVLGKEKVVQEYWPGMHNFHFWNEAIPKALAFFGFSSKQNEVI